MNKKEEIKRHILERIKSPIEWPDFGQARMGLLPVAFDNGRYVEELQ